MGQNKNFKIQLLQNKITTYIKEDTIGCLKKP